MHLIADQTIGMWTVSFTYVFMLCERPEITYVQLLFLLLRFGVHLVVRYKTNCVTSCGDNMETMATAAGTTECRSFQGGKTWSSMSPLIYAVFVAQQISDRFSAPH